MKSLIQNHGLTVRTCAGCLPGAILLAGLVAAYAQPLQPEVLFNFPRGGAYPQGNVVQGSDGNFYGTTARGGSSDAGTVFKVTTNGTLVTLFSFSEANVGFADFTHGRFPFGGLTLGSDGNFYGTTSSGGSHDSGTVFRMTSDGTLTTLVSFDVFLDGGSPKAGLTLGNDGNFYGTTEFGGFGLGTFFRVTTNGTLTKLASFTGDVVANPKTALTLGNDGNFYSTTQDGGSSGVGTVFKVTTNGTLTRLVSFNTVNGARPSVSAGLTLGNDGNFYGTAQEGGSGGVGTVFKVTTNGTLTRLVSFNTVNGAYPQTALTLGSGGIFYGTTSQGGSSGVGTVFKVTTSGTLTRLVSFNTTNGAYPQAALTLGSDGNFYGTTFQGGGTDLGTVFKMTTTGTLTRLASFNSTINGAYPQAGLALGSDGNFYGATTAGGSSGLGTVFKMTTNGTQTTLASFAGTNGADPQATLTLGSDGNFYGTTYSGGSSVYWGTVFKVTTNGTLTTLVSFDYPNGGQGLTLGSDGNFYGTTSQGGSSGMGTVFKVTTNGTLTTLASFAGTNGANPQAGLTLGSDGMFYGTTYGGGSTGNGTVFQVTTNGTLTTLVSFAGTNGSNPRAALTLGNDGNFYGTTYYGSSGSGPGTVFKVTTNGTLTTLASFDYSTTGALPQAALTLGSDGNFYGTATEGGSGFYYGLNSGTVFQVTPNGTLTRLISFNTANGAHPYAGLTLGSDGHFYGTTRDGGSAGLGTVFRLSNAPQFLAQPQPASQVVPAGVNVTIDASVFGAPPLSYQWRFNGTNLPGETNAALTLSNVSLSMAGNYSLYVANSLGTTLSSNAVLTVLTAIVTTLPVSGISATGAVLRGSVTLGPNETLAWFEWGTDTNYGQIHGATVIPGGSGTVTSSNALNGLDGDLIYHYRAAASNSFGIAYGTNQSFQVGLVPTAVTLGATGITTNSVALNASANPGGRHTTVWFQWGTNNFPYGNLTPETSVGSGPASLNFSHLIAGLSLNTLYHGRVVASNSLGQVTGGDVSFLIGTPLAVTGPATLATGTNAWINGRVTPNSLPTTAWFEWGINTSYGNTVLLGAVGSGSAALAVSSLLTSLDAAVTYHFRLAASNSAGIAFGADAQISTSSNAYAESVLADQPLLYYRFDEASGTTALNSGFLGAPANGTYNATVSLGNPSLAPAFGYAAGFDNTNSSVAVPALGTYNQITIETWAKPRSFGVASSGDYHSQHNSIYTTDNFYGTAGSLNTHFVNFNVSPFPIWQLAINDGNGPQEVNVGNSGFFPSNSWVHLAATYDSAARKIITYVNGYPLATNMFPQFFFTAVPVNLTAAHIGAWIGNANWFDGGLDEFAIYGTALPASRIQAHYQTAIGNPVLLSAQTTNKLAFSWAGPGFKLESNPDLSNGAGWTNVPAGSNSPVSVTLSNSGNQFFRLRWP